MNNIKLDVPKRFGYIQRDVLNDLLTNGETDPLCFYVVSQRHYTRYINSIKNAIKWLEEQGFEVELRLGRNGGYWSAVYSLSGKK